MVKSALSKFKASDQTQAESIHKKLLTEFPDYVSSDTYWHEFASTAFKDFFTWGHNHDFGFGVKRKGAMRDRHVEIASEAISRGLMEPDLTGKSVLDIGCWSGGDALILNGLGAGVTALEEHKLSAGAAKLLFLLVGADVELVIDSLYNDRRDWAQLFDFIYCSGVIYHVTDPLLFLRICYAYLKPGGKLLIETKAARPGQGDCLYSGTLVKGWNWFSPNRETLGRWLFDTGFPAGSIKIFQRPVGRLLAAAQKGEACALSEPAGFSRPGSWLEGKV